MDFCENGDKFSRYIIVGIFLEANVTNFQGRIYIPLEELVGWLVG
jgi:hypothetical protein